MNHFSPNTPALDLVLDGVVVNTDSIEYAETNPYIYTPSGERRVRLNRTGTSKNYFGADRFLIRMCAIQFLPAIHYLQ
ncbi:MAG: DUF4397 domain-containing protein [Bacteroidota bacterium]|nr:MAG: DUF4397 domain-containing protein [Bacteroidota bacterium]